MMTKYLAVLALTGLLLTGCAAATTPSIPAETPRESQTHTPAADPATSMIHPTPWDQPAADRAKQQLSQRLGARALEIEVESVRAVDWPDASLGCPEPGMTYMQVHTPGYLIALQYQGEIFEYHTDAIDQIVLCEDPEHRLIPDHGDGDAQLPTDGGEPHPDGDDDSYRDEGAGPQPANIPGEPTPPPTCRFCMNGWGGS